MIRLKKIAILALAFVVSLSLVAGAMAAPQKDTPVKVVLNGRAKALKPGAFARGGKVYLPLNAMASAVGAKVTSNKAAKSYVVTAGGQKTTIKASQGVMAGGQFMVPMQLAATALHCDAKWNAGTKTVTVTTKSEKAPPKAPPAPSGGG